MQAAFQCLPSLKLLDLYGPFEYGSDGRKWLEERAVRAAGVKHKIRLAYGRGGYRSYV